MFSGVLELSFWGYFAVTLVLTHLTIISVTVYLHRHQAHRALELHPAVSHCFRFWLWLTTGIVTKEWAAVHRKHHAKCETAEDPHSPRTVGIHKVLWQGASLYREAARDPQVTEKYGHGTPDDWLERNLYTKHSYAGIVLMLFINLGLFGVAGLVIWAVQMHWIPFFAAGVINGLGHYWGYRNYEVADASTNLLPWGILIGGEELHNNHHAYGSSAKLSSKWYEFDIGWLYIRVLAALKLARVKKVAPKLLIQPGKQWVDVDTLRAVVAHRFRLLTAYGREVMAPVLQEEAAHFSGNALYRRARNWLLRHEALMDAKAQQELSAMLKDNQRLETVYRFRQQLQALWSQAWSSQEALLYALQEWCRQAEESGIKALQDFALSLRGYSLQQV
ncbi:Fatty acid desaturase [Nitrosococcus oceani ATCC 19707]|uniref:Fatty acid desaturase n=5 Tax=Nitrosococcus oceani TaxID=1229 RepID=Q3J7V1_NITOC|nr:fatty acid desaturase [Nitrosococcus oceani]ABA59095.1 Fatty acid desaturase [Nitrosococcus oceani ATCC 19707]EDZ65989.1 Fatty acid desaturase domain protein [Nitrosococcus oceani AFC27]